MAIMAIDTQRRSRGCSPCAVKLQIQPEGDVVTYRIQIFLEGYSLLGVVGRLSPDLQYVTSPVSTGSCCKVLRKVVRCRCGLAFF
jgi:hypothetical protein